jgi:hypothetical protein
MNNLIRTRPLAVVAAILVFGSTGMQAHHSWRNYHWARTTTVLALLVGDNVSNAWDSYLDEAIGDWNVSGAVALTKTAGGTNPATCNPVAGRIEACNGAYGQNGWLGIAQIWITGRTHITQATTRLNDTYFAMTPYNSPAWRRLVTCQEIAHDFGLDHQDERNNNTNLGSCMDYTNDPDGGSGGWSPNDPSNEHPNAHDFEQLHVIYGHKDSTSTATALGAAGAAAPSVRARRPEAAEWGQLVRTSPDNRVQTYERDLGNGNRVVTHVFWADPDADGRHDH